WCHAASARWPMAFTTISVAFQPCVRKVRAIAAPSRFHAGRPSARRRSTSSWARRGGGVRMAGASAAPLDLDADDRVGEDVELLDPHGGADGARILQRQGRHPL